MTQPGEGIMTKIITRYFDSGEKARLVKHELVQRQKASPRIMEIFDTPKDMGEALGKAGVRHETIAEYEKRLADGGAVMIVKAGYKPLGIAKTTRDVMAAHGPVDLGDLIEEVVMKEEFDPLANTLLLDHPLLMSRPRDPDSTTFHMANWPIPLISRRKPMTESVIEPHAYMANRPIGHLVPHDVRYGRFPFGLLVPGNKYMAKFPFGHIVPGHKYMAKFPFAHIVPGHKHMAKFPFGHIVPGHKFMAKFPFGHLVPGGMRMANWPFPLLINGKPGTNSLVPGQKYMAKFPFAHLIPGHKHQAKFPFGHIVPGHKFMAKFPFAHIVPGHRFMAKFPFGHIVPGHKHMAKFPFAHIVPGHKYMANWIFPHTKAKAGQA